VCKWFFLGLFHDAVSSYDTQLQIRRDDYEEWVVKDMEEDSRGLFEGTIYAFVCGNWDVAHEPYKETERTFLVSLSRIHMHDLFSQFGGKI